MHVLVMFIIDLKGRRLLLLTGLIGMSVSCFILALTRIFLDQLIWLKYIAVISASLYIIFYSLGPGII